jgi:hypothetical protein
MLDGLCSSQHLRWTRGWSTETALRVLLLLLLLLLRLLSLLRLLLQSANDTRRRRLIRARLLRCRLLWLLLLRHGRCWWTVCDRRTRARL